MTKPTIGNGQLVYWILGALMTLVGILSGIAHSAIVRQLGNIEHRLDRLEEPYIRVQK